MIYLRTKGRPIFSLFHYVRSKITDSPPCRLCFLSQAYSSFTRRIQVRHRESRRRGRKGNALVQRVVVWYLTIEQVNKSVGKGLADAIEKGEKATYAAKDTIGGSVLHSTY